MALHSLFLWIIACYGVICVGITAVFAFSKSGVDVMVSYLNSYDGCLVDSLIAWRSNLQYSLERCQGLFGCTADMSLQVIDLFFLFTYIPLCAMFAAFILSNPTIKRALFGEYVSRFLSSSLDVVAEMPALEHANAQPIPSSGSSVNRRRTSSAGRSSKVISEQLIFDDTFGIIRKDILESWNQPKKISINTDFMGETTERRNPLPPVRSITPKAPQKTKKAK